MEYNRVLDPNLFALRNIVQKTFLDPQGPIVTWGPVSGLLCLIVNSVIGTDQNIN